MISRSRSVALVAMLGVGLGAGYAIRAVASGIPATAALTYAGMLESGAGPMTGTPSIQIYFYDSSDAGSVSDILCQTTPATTNVVNGHFSVVLPDACTSAVAGNPNVWVDVFVNGIDSGRTKIGAVPYAVEANHAPNADNALNAVDGGSIASAIASLEQSVATIQTNVTTLQGQVASNSGKVAGMWINSPTAGCVSINSSTDWVDVAGTAVTFSLTQAANVSATYAMNAQTNGVSTPQSEYVGFRLNVDGTGEQSSGNHLQPFSTADDNFTTVGNWVGTLGSGSHTVKLQWATDNSTTVSWQNCWGNDGSWQIGGLPAADQTSIGQRSVVVMASYQ